MNRSNLKLVGNTTAAQNVGIGNGLFKEKINGNTLQFRSIYASGGTIITQEDDRLIISSTADSGDFISWSSFEFRDIVAGVSTEYTLDIKATVSYNITSAVFQVNDGTLDDVTVRVNGTDVPGLTSVTASTTITEIDATSPYTVNVGDIVTLYVGTTYTGDPSYLRGKLNIKYN